jgi:hypothetical protein
MKAFEQYFSDEMIINVLIGQRLRAAEKRHRYHFLGDMSTAAPDPLEKVPRSVDQLLPPRRAWRRPRQDTRRGQCKEQINRSALKRTVFGYIKSGRISETDWGVRLQAFLQDVRSRLQLDEHAFSEPRIILIDKPGKKHVFRTIAQYEDPSDRVVLTLLARYLRDCFDADLSGSLYSFRGDSQISHHTAICSLEQFRQEHESEGLYVAECDIRSFFDIAPHDELRRVFAEAVGKARERSVEVDLRAIAMFHAYLSSYSFYETALPAAKKLLKERSSHAKIEYAKKRELQRLGHSCGSPMVGIPQGGALSPLLANLLLSSVDEAVMQVDDDTRPFYARFCDDVIFAHSSRSQCADALKRCIDEMKRLKIPVHRPVKVARYDKDYYKTKSKAPYLWAQPDGSKSVVPWVSFVGYQMRYDGKLRIRQQSVEKEQSKQRRLIADVLRVVTADDARLRGGGELVLSRTRARLISMSIGRKKLRQLSEGSRQPCWADAFYLVDANVHVGNQLRTLDRSRERELRRLVRLLRRFHALGPPEDEDEISGSVPDGPTPFYWGAPYSYYGYFFGSKRSPISYPVRSKSSDYST